MSTLVPTQIHILRRGEFPHRASGTVQVIDDYALERMVRNFSPTDQGQGVLIDFDHFSYNSDKPSNAAGWITGLKAYGDGLWANVAWSRVGHDSVAGQEYRFVSPTFIPRDLQPLGGNRVRPIRIDRVALTNDPNIKGCTPLSSLEPICNSKPNVGMMALREFQVLVNRIKHDKKDTFARAWNRASNSFPALYRMACALSNRESPLDDPEVKELLERNEAAVMLKLSQDFEEATFRDQNPLEKIYHLDTASSMYQEIKRRIKSLMEREPGLTIAQVIQRVRQEAPEYWAIMVASQDV